MGKGNRKSARRSTSKKTKKSKKTKRASATPRGIATPMTPAMVPWNPMTPGLVPQPTPPVEDSSSSESDSSQSSTSSSAVPIKAKGAIPLMQVPKKYLQGVVQAMAPPLTPVCTSEWQVADLVRMIWILARVRPQAQTSAFKSKTYGALNRAFATGHKTFVRTPALLNWIKISKPLSFLTRIL